MALKKAAIFFGRFIFFVLSSLPILPSEQLATCSFTLGKWARYFELMGSTIRLHCSRNQRWKEWQSEREKVLRRDRTAIVLARFDDALLRVVFFSFRSSLHFMHFSCFNLNLVRWRSSFCYADIIVTAAKY